MLDPDGKNLSHLKPVIISLRLLRIKQGSFSRLSPLDSLHQEFNNNLNDIITNQKGSLSPLDSLHQEFNNNLNDIIWNQKGSFSRIISRIVSAKNSYVKIQKILFPAHTHAHIHTYAHTHTHTHIRTHTYAHTRT